MISFTIRFRPLIVLMLKRIPSENDLSRLYYELARVGASAIGSRKPWPYHPKSLEELLVLACSMVRYDPRLLGILIIYFKDFWEDIHLIKLRKALAIGETPQVIGIIGEFVKRELRNPEVTYLFEYLTRGMKPVPLQLFFIGTYPFGSRHLEAVIQHSLK